MYKLVSEVCVGKFNVIYKQYSFHQAQLAQLEEYQILLLVRVPLWARIFNFVFCRFRALLADPLVPYKWNQAWRSSEV